MLHDTGKLAIPTRVLRGTDTLSDADLALVATHAARGVGMVSDIEFLSDSTQGILRHHERLDGRGYPTGLGGQDIPLFARIIAVTDAFDFLHGARRPFACAILADPSRTSFARYRALPPPSAPPARSSPWLSCRWALPPYRCSCSLWS